jgi:hypothetical protein
MSFLKSIEQFSRAFWQAGRSSQIVVFIIITALMVPSVLVTAQASDFYNQVFGNKSPGYGTYEHRRKYRKMRRKQRYSIGRIEKPRAALTTEKSKSKTQILKKANLKNQSTKPGTRSRNVYRRSLRPSGRSYRTMCVRECDGYFFPVSFATGKRNFKADAETCRSSCGKPARLYIYPNPGGELEDMVAYKSGKAYRDLPNAFLFKKKFVADCRCQPEPWTPVAKARHAKYAKANLDPYKELAKRERKEKRRYTRVNGRKAKSWKRRARQVARRNKRKYIYRVKTTSGHYWKKHKRLVRIKKYW